MGLRIAAPTLLKKPTKLGVTPGFNPDEEQNPLTNPKRKKLVPLEPMRTEEQIKKEREEEAKQIVAMIPASKADLFNFQLSWDIVDEVCFHDIVLGLSRGVVLTWGSVWRARRPKSFRRG